MKITKARLRQIIMEELQSEAFGQGEPCPPGEDCPEEELEERAFMTTADPKPRKADTSRRAEKETPAEKRRNDARIAKLDAAAAKKKKEEEEEEEKKVKKEGFGDLEELKRLIARELKNLL